MVAWAVLILLRTWRGGGSFEHSNEQPGSTKCGEFLDCYPGKRTLLPAVIYGPFSDALSISDYGPYMNDEQWNGEDMEGTGRELL